MITLKNTCSCGETIELTHKLESTTTSIERRCGILNGIMAYWREVHKDCKTEEKSLSLSKRKPRTGQTETLPLTKRVEQIIKDSKKPLRNRDITTALQERWEELKEKKDLPALVSTIMNRLRKKNPHWLDVHEQKKGIKSYSRKEEPDYLM